MKIKGFHPYLGFEEEFRSFRILSRDLSAIGQCLVGTTNKTDGYPFLEQNGFRLKFSLKG